MNKRKTFGFNCARNDARNVDIDFFITLLSHFRRSARLPRKKINLNLIQFRPYSLSHCNENISYFHFACAASRIDRKRLSAGKLHSARFRPRGRELNSPECTRQGNKILRLFAVVFFFSVVDGNLVNRSNSLLLSLNTHILHQWQNQHQLPFDVERHFLADYSFPFRRSHQAIVKLFK